MTPAVLAPIRLKEYQTTHLPRTALSDAEGELLWRTYGNYVGVEFPSPKTEQQWELTPRGWVGYIPLSSDRVLALEPKVTLGNLFGMLEYAYRLPGFKFLPELVHTQSLAEFYESLAEILAKRVLDRARRQQRLVGAPLDDLPAVDDQHLIGVADGAQPVGLEITDPDEYC